jgi:hypothetical protein
LQKEQLSSLKFVAKCRGDKSKTFEFAIFSSFKDRTEPRGFRSPTFVSAIFNSSKFVKVANGDILKTAVLSMYNLFNLGKHKNYCTSFKVFDDGDCHIELVEDVQYEDKKDIYEREKHYIKNNDCVNKSIPNRTRLEYYNDNADKLKQHQCLLDPLN